MQLAYMIGLFPERRQAHRSLIPLLLAD